MSGAQETGAIDALLGKAEVLADVYGEREVAALRARIAAAVPAPRASPDSPPVRQWPGPRSEHYPTDGEQAAHDLDLAASLVVGAPEAAPSLAMLGGGGRCVAPEGALVFACLLHLAGYAEAAQFWWQFAAGGGSATAAFCLCLHHRRRGEFRDADYWRTQSSRLGAGSPRAAPGAGEASHLPHGQGLLPQRVRHALLSQCQRGGRPRLPRALEAVIHRLPAEEADEDFGEIPRPSADLPQRLAGSPRDR